MESTVSNGNDRSEKRQRNDRLRKGNLRRRQRFNVKVGLDIKLRLFQCEFSIRYAQQNDIKSIKSLHIWCEAKRVKNKGSYTTTSRIFELLWIL